MSRRLAVVIDTVLGRMQVRRVLTRPNAACFASCEEAEAWLLADPAAEAGVTVKQDR